jgi:tetratricopeptide (TPR) repeat protein
MSESRRFIGLVLVGVTVLLIGAGTGQPPDDLVRAGNDAFARNDLDAAESLYRQAEERAADPGLVAFNKGTTLYLRGEFRRAELCFRRALGDAAIPAARRDRALYNLGNCLVRQAGETDIKQLQMAIDCFDMVVHETNDPGMHADAGHNLEVAKLLWAKARARRPPGERDPDWDESSDSRPPRDPGKTETSIDNAKENGGKTLEPGAKVDGGKETGPGLAPRESPRAVPARGNLPVLPDTGDVEPLSAEQAHAVLQRAAERLQRERQKLREDAIQGDRPRVNDW